MSLDPQVKALLDAFAEQNAGQPKMSELPPADARQLYLGMAAMLDLTDVPIGKSEDRTIPGPAGDIPVRIYTPVAAGGGSLPLLMFFHGGGWVIGDLDTHDSLCRTLANESGCKVVAVDYRLAPENPYPAAVDDCYAALVWAEGNAHDLGVDPNRIAVTGDSAGGNLAAAMCLKAKAEGGPKIGFQLLIYPVTDAGMQTGSYKSFPEGYFLEADSMAWFFDSYAPSGVDRSEPYLSPLQAKDLSGLPKAMVITAGFDVLRDEGKAYAEALKKAGVEVDYVNYDGMIHGFFNTQAAIGASTPAIKKAAKAIAAALG